MNIANLPYSFSIEDIKEAYHLRWGCEVAFRYLKHAAGLLYFHSKKPEFLKQEIYAKLVLYNFGIILANKAAEEKDKEEPNPNNKYNYKVNFSSALKRAREYFISRLPNPFDVIGCIMLNVYAEKENFRHFNRPLRGIGAISFGYR